MKLRIIEPPKCSFCKYTIASYEIEIEEDKNYIRLCEKCAADLKDKLCDAIINEIGD